MKCFSIGDYTFDAAGVDSLRSSMIELRNGALEQNEFGWAVTLSHVIAMMAHVRDELVEND